MFTSNDILAIFTLINGIVSGTVLVLPVISLKVGYIPVPIVIAFFGFASFYTGYLIIIHSQHHQSIYESIMHHFGGSKVVGKGYCIFITLSLFSGLLAYFQLMVQQIQGLLNQKSEWLSVAILIFIIVLSMLENYFHFGEKVMGFGVLTVFSFIIFILYTIATSPSGNHTIPTVGDNFTRLVTTILYAMDCHEYLFYVLIRTTERKSFVKVTKVCFLICTLVYIFISYGSFGIANRTPRKQAPEEIIDFFPFASWEVMALQIIYFLHLATIFPEINFVVKRRVLDLLGFQEDSFLKSLIFIVISTSLCFLVLILEIKVTDLLSITGAIFTTISTFILPIFVHIKCIFFDRKQQVEADFSSDSDEQEEIVCRIQYKSKFTKYLETIFLVVLTLMTTGISLFEIYKTLSKN